MSNMHWLMTPWVSKSGMVSLQLRTILDSARALVHILVACALVTPLGVGKFRISGTVSLGIYSRTFKPSFGMTITSLVDRRFLLLFKTKKCRITIIGIKISM